MEKEKYSLRFQLLEKDKEIKELKSRLEVCHQVFEVIREKAYKDVYIDKNENLCYYFIITQEKLLEIEGQFK